MARGLGASKLVPCYKACVAKSFQLAVKVVPSLQGKAPSDFRQTVKPCVGREAGGTYSRLLAPLNDL